MKVFRETDGPESTQFEACSLPLMEDMDSQLTEFVNILGLVIFTSVVLYHVIVASPKDAK